LEAECREVFETGGILVSSLGFPLFDPVSAGTKADDTEEVFYLRSPKAGAEGKGLYTSEGFVVLAGSIGRLENAPSLKGTSDERYRQRMIDAGVMKELPEGKVVFPKDHLFKTPSGGAIALLGRACNGWSEWKNAEGQTLHQLKRGGTAEQS
jgi:hypothetical protein